MKLTWLAQIAHNDVAVLLERAVGGVHDEIATVGEAARADRIGLGEAVLDLSGARVPDLARGVGRAGHEVDGLPVDVYAPDGTIVANVGA